MTDNRTTELLCCPFCGGEAHTIEPARYGKSWGVRCECGAFLGFEYTEAEAIAAWNTRAERTCHDAGESRLFRCSECGFGIEDAYLANEGAYGLELDFVRFCPSCGAKVEVNNC